MLSLSVISITLCVLMSANAAHAFQCTVRSDQCNPEETAIMGMSYTTNAHAEKGDQNYPYVLCCSDSASLGTDCSGLYFPVFYLAGSTNSHAADPTFPPEPGYEDTDNWVCLSSSSGLPYCTTVDDPLKEGCEMRTGGLEPVCMATIFRETNSHVATCDDPLAYDTRICCRTSLEPRVIDIEVLNLYNGKMRGNARINATAIDPDGDQITDMRYTVEYTGTGSPASLDYTNPPQFEVVWDTRGISGVMQDDVKIRANAYSRGTWGDEWREEFFDVDNTPPDAWITGPPDDEWVGRIFTVTWENNTYTNGVYFQYADALGFGATGWEPSSPPLDYDNAYEMDLSTLGAGEFDYCYRVDANDVAGEIDGTPSCDPSGPGDITSECNCSKVDASPPSVSSVGTSREYVTSDTFDVTWSGSDGSGSGIKCFQVQYRIDDTKAGTQGSWTPWSGINDINDASIYQSGSCSAAVSCSSDLDGTEFDQEEVVGSSEDGRTFVFRARALDRVERDCSNVASWVESAAPYGSTTIDWTEPPDVTIEARDVEGSVIVSPEGSILTGTPVDFRVTSDPSNQDYSGVVESGIVYNVWRLGTDYLVSGPITLNSCPTNNCDGTKTWEDDYNITYYGYSTDRAGNTNVTETKSFIVTRPVGISSTVSSLYMVLGTYEIVPVTVSNRQEEPEPVSVKITGDYPYSRFVDISEGVLSSDNKTLDITLQAKETKSFHAFVYTADVGDYTMNIVVNSTREGYETRISDAMSIDVRIVFPEEFDGLSWVSVLVVMISAVILYTRFGRE